MHENNTLTGQNLWGGGGAHAPSPHMSQACFMLLVGISGVLIATIYKYIKPMGLHRPTYSRVKTYLGGGGGAQSFNNSLLCSPTKQNVLFSKQSFDQFTLKELRCNCEEHAQVACKVLQKSMWYVSKWHYWILGAPSWAETTTGIRFTH